jgi:hypothetical protein
MIQPVRLLQSSGRRADGELRPLRDGRAEGLPRGRPGSAKGLTLFGAIIYAPSASINTMPVFASTGASYGGLLPTRDRDTAARQVAAEANPGGVSSVGNAVVLGVQIGVEF